MGSIWIAAGLRHLLETYSRPSWPFRAQRLSRLSLAWNCASGEVDEGGGFRVEGGNGFGKARDRESVADAAGSTDQPQ